MTYYTGFRVGALRITAGGLIYFIVGTPNVSSSGRIDVFCARLSSGSRIESFGQLYMFYSSREIA